MTDLKELIELELVSFLEWPSVDKGSVTTTSAKLFAEHVARLYADHIPDAGKMAAPAVQGEPVGFVNPKLMRHLGVSHDGVVMGSKADSDRTMPLYAAPQPAEQQALKSSLALDASVHLTNWLNMSLCECEGGHTCGYNDVMRTRDALLEAAEQPECGCCAQTTKCDDDCDAKQPAPDVAGLVEALESLIKGYVGLLEAGMDRITSLGGDCDPVPVMEQNDPWLRDARAALAAHRKQGSEA